MTFHWIDALTTPKIDVPAFPARSPSPGKDTAGEISLFTSSRDGIVALVAGKDWRWAHTALDTAGFSKTADGHRCLPLKGGDLGRTRDALHVLGVLTQMAGVPVIANTKVYIGDFARDLAEYLPGHWDVWVESYAIQTWQGDLAAWMWSPSLTATLDQHRVPRAALLKHSDGVELAVIEDPTADRFHVGTLHPKDLFADGLVTSPAGVTVAPEPAFAAVDISSRLLPAYARAVLHYQVNALEEDLNWARSARSDAAPDPLPTALVEAFARFSDAAPRICTAVRQLAALTEDERATLLRINDVVAAPAISPDAPAIPRVNPVDWWLKEAGDSLIALARRAVPDAEPATAKPDRPSLGTAAALSPPPRPGTPRAHR
ncbi:hypothetical protein [Streptomyces anulatus]|uniref:hypothetical protein n=1 Tax=Streptomyces anulatus TaxID=1892 RepID=UPI003679A03C